eukprot:6471738-Amphidinium_carterae.2
MTKYLDTAKIKKHSETIGLHANTGSRGSINMIGFSIRLPNPQSPPRYTSTPRATTLKPRIKVHQLQQPIKVEEVMDGYELIQDIAEADPYLYNNHGEEAANDYDLLRNNEKKIERSQT